MKYVFSLFVSMFAAASVMTAQTSYTITDLATSEGANIPYAINNSGQVVGDKEAENAFLYSGGNVTYFATLGGTYSVANGINDWGQVSGWSYIPGDTSIHSFLYDINTGIATDLGTLGGTFSGAGAANKLGQVVGSSQLPGDSAEHAFLYTSASGMVDLNSQIPSGSGWILIGGSSINDSGQLTGDAQTPTSGTGSHAFIYRSGNLLDLGTLGGHNSTGVSINSFGQVAGTSDTGILDTRYGYQYRAFLYSPGAGMSDLGSPTGLWSRGSSVNNSGQVTGTFLVTTRPSQTQPYSTHAFLYTAATGTIDLNSLLPTGSPWTLTNGLAINDAGQIAGLGAINGGPHGFILSPPLSQQLTNLIGALPASPLTNALLKYIPNITTTISSLSTKTKQTYIAQLQQLISGLQSSSLPSTQTAPLMNLANALMAALSA